LERYPSPARNFSLISIAVMAGVLAGCQGLNKSPQNSPTNSGTLSVGPASLNFGSVVVGAKSSKSGSLTATNAAVKVSSGTSNSSEFVLSGIQFPARIEAGQSASFAVTFAPNSSGTANAQLMFASDASNSPTIESLTGTGIAAPQHWVNLTWSPSQGAVSYNVYRKFPNDAKYSQIDSGEAATAYTDNNVAAGKTYDYVVTAVDSNNVESGYSNRAEVTVPSP